MKDLAVQDVGLPDCLSTCPVCACTLKNTEELHVCDDCDTPHHTDCWEYTGGCAIFGCRRKTSSSSSGAPSNKFILDSLTLPLLRFWSAVLYLDSVTFLMISTSILVFAVVFFAVWWSFLFNFAPLFFILSIIFTGALLMFVIALPINVLCFLGKILMRLHFSKFDSSPPKIEQKHIIEAVEKVPLPPQLFSYSNFLQKFAITIYPYMYYGSIAYPVSVVIFLWFVKAPAAPPLIFMVLICPMLLFCSFFVRHFVALVKRIMDYELVLYASYQNRLVASTKKLK